MTATTRSRAFRIAGFASIPAALVLAGAVVGGASYSAFSATTSTPTNNWSAGTVSLNNDQSSALFNATGLKPGSTDTKYITVTSTGSLASTVKLYGTNAATTNALSSYIDITITEGTGTATNFTPNSGSPLYTGTLANFASTETNFSNGLTAWQPAGGAAESRVFKITYGLESTTPNSAQGGTAALAFTWEAQNN